MNSPRPVLHEITNPQFFDALPGERAFTFHCPGCGFAHFFRTGSTRGWTWNSDMVRPTIMPSLRVDGGAAGLCHSWIKDGRIQFLADCTAHRLGNQTVDIPAWED